MARRASREFTPEPGEVGAARRFARTVAGEWSVDADGVELVVGELAANAVLHARSSYSVTLCRDGDWVLVEVADHNARLPISATVPAQALSGRGLTIVDRLARTWGVRPESGGKVVWAELPASPVRRLWRAG